MALQGLLPQCTANYYTCTDLQDVPRMPISVYTEAFSEGEKPHPLAKSISGWLGQDLRWHFAFVSWRSPSQPQLILILSSAGCLATLDAIISTQRHFQRERFLLLKVCFTPPWGSFPLRDNCYT